MDLSQEQSPLWKLLLRQQHASSKAAPSTKWWREFFIVLSSTEFRGASMDRMACFHSTLAAFGPLDPDQATIGKRSGYIPWPWRRIEFCSRVTARAEHLIRPEVIYVLNGEIGLVGAVVLAGCRETLSQGVQVLKPMGPLGISLV
jgi:hypothetical protein